MKKCKIICDNYNLHCYINYLTWNELSLLIIENTKTFKAVGLLPNEYQFQNDPISMFPHSSSLFRGQFVREIRYSGVIGKCGAINTQQFQQHPVNYVVNKEVVVTAKKWPIALPIIICQVFRLMKVTKGYNHRK